MKTKRMLIIAALATLLSTTTLYAAENAQEIQMVSGGIGDGEMDDIAATQKNYSLKLVFAQTNGEYLADIGVKVRDHSGNIVVNTTSGGPILLMNLTPGSYTVISTVAGEKETQRVMVNSHGLKTYIIHMHSTES